MNLARFIRPPAQIRYAADFVVAHFTNESVGSYFSRPEFVDYVKRVGDMSWREAATEYRAITGEDLMSGAIGAVIARRVALPHSK